MSDQVTQPAALAAPASTPVAAAVAAKAPLSQAQGLEAYKATRAAERAGTANPLSDAARTMGKRAQEARQERQAQAPANTQTPPEEEEQHVEDDSPIGETRDDLTPANGEQPNDGTTHTDGEPGDTQTIDLGDGVAVSLDEVRDGFMMKADHTRKTQALAQERQHFETDRTQRVTLLDHMLTATKQMLPEFKPVHVLMDEMGDGPGMREFARQQALLSQIGSLEQARQQEQAHHNKQLRDATIKTLADKYGDKAPSHYDGAVKIASEWTGMDANYLANMMAHPSIPDIVHDAKQWRDLQSKKGNVQRTVADKPRVVRPGARVSPQSAGQQNIQNAHAKLKSSGNLADAVSFLRTLRGTKGRAG